MARNSTTHPRPEGHVLVPACAIGGLSVVLAVGLELLGVHRRMNEVIGAVVSIGGKETFPKHLPVWGVWLAASLIAFALAFAMLATPGGWRRFVLWITSVVLVSAWAPVLSLAAHAPEISAPWIAAVWSGVCALVYTANHRMPCEESLQAPDEPR